jgi:DNA-binding protein WhiA
MSFSSDIKNEIAHTSPPKNCCAAAELAGFIRSCGSLTLSGKAGMGVRMSTEHAAVARHIKTVLAQQFGINAKLMVGEAALGRSSHVFELVIQPGPKAEKLLVQAGVITLTGDTRSLAGGFTGAIMRRKCCRKACLKGLFLGAGTMADPEKGYDLEIALSSEQTANAVKRLLNAFTDIHAKIRKRRGSYVVYLNASEEIKDIMNIIGAHAQLLKYENVRVLKEVRNRTNRINNCDNANYEKQISAAARQIADIEQLQEADALDSLPPDLFETALLRLGSPEASLAEIGALSLPQITKAAVAARFKRISEIAKTLYKT